MFIATGHTELRTHGPEQSTESGTVRFLKIVIYVRGTGVKIIILVK